jgi:uncharacterized protein (TIGR02147 family)
MTGSEKTPAIKKNRKSEQALAITGHLPDVFNYDHTNFRKYLKQYYREKKTKTSSFSYGVLSLQTKLNRGYIHKIFNEESCNISTLQCFRLSLALMHTKEEAEYFENIVTAAMAENDVERAFYIEKAKRVKTKTETVSPGQLKKDQYQLKKDQCEYLSKWYHPAIYSLISIQPFIDEFSQLSQKLNPSITEIEVKNSIQLLIRLGLITKRVDGAYHVTEKKIEAGDGIPQEKRNSYFLEFSELAKNSITQCPQKLRNIQSVTLGISEGTYEIISREIDQFNNKILDLAYEDKNADRIYQFNSAFFPLLKIQMKKGSNS